MSLFHYLLQFSSYPFRLMASVFRLLASVLLRAALLALVVFAVISQNDAGGEQRLLDHGVQLARKHLTSLNTEQIRSASSEIYIWAKAHLPEFRTTDCPSQKA
jgi:hypothetical protein